MSPLISILFYLQAAFSDFDNASEPSLRRDYMKLCYSLDKRTEVLFSRLQRAQLEMYHIVGWTQNEMHTDDSFVFNKVRGPPSCGGYFIPGPCATKDVA